MLQVFLWNYFNRRGTTATM